MADYFRTFPSYVGFDSMTYESNYLKQHEFPDLDKISEFSDTELDADELLVWFRGKEPIAFISRGDIEWVPLKKGANLTKLIVSKKIEIDRTGTICRIYPMSLIDKTMEELEAIVPIKQVEFWGNLNMLKFKGLFSREIASTNKVFMICLHVKPHKDPFEWDRLTWKSTTFGHRHVPLYLTTELWQVIVITNMEELQQDRQIDLLFGACVSKADAAWLANCAHSSRYYQECPTSTAIYSIKKKLKNKSQTKLDELFAAEITDNDIVIVMHRLENRLSYEVEDVTDYLL